MEVDGREREMVFLTNNLDWSPASVADLYRSRWSIEVFFKQIKQTLQLADFLGHSANAVRWQIWTALAGLCAVALPGLRAWMASQLHAHLHADPQRLLAAVGSAGSITMLWDSIRCVPLHCHSAAAVLRRVLTIPVGQLHGSVRQRGIRKS